MTRVLGYSTLRGYANSNRMATEHWQNETQGRAQMIYFPNVNFCISFDGGKKIDSVTTLNLLARVTITIRPHTYFGFTSSSHVPSPSFLPRQGRGRRRLGQQQNPRHHIVDAYI